MVTLAILAAFFGGIVLGAILLATYHDTLVADDPWPGTVPAPEPVVVAPAPEPDPEPEPEPGPEPEQLPPPPAVVRDRFVCVLVGDAGEESVRTMAYLPTKIERQHGPHRADTYRYVGLGADGRHRFEVTHG